MQKCIETYDHNRHMVGIPVEGKSTLAPLYFIKQNAQIEVTITEEGEFREARAIPKKDAETLIPVTEKSGQRSSNKSAPHPLCDQLKYIALGHPNLPSHEQCAEKFNAYTELLEKWAHFSDSHFIVEAVYKYVMSGTLIFDLIASNILECEVSGALKKGKISGTDHEKCLVRWRVLKADAIGESWLNPELAACYARFYISELADGKSTLCYVTGKLAPSAEGFPKGISKFANEAKLLSTKGNSGFTYQGRFKDAGEAFSVSSEASQKAHAALTWLVANQGRSYGNRIFVCWNPEGSKVPSFDSDDLYAGLSEAQPAMTLTMPQYADRLQKAIAGYREELGDRTGIIIMTMEAATTGRMSVTYYNELQSSDYLDRLQSWQESCCWYDTKKGEIRSPSITEIIRYAYGTEQTGSVKADDRLLKEHSQRILHCIADAAPLPYDIVRSITRRAALRQAYKDSNYKKLLFVACALIRKYRYDQSNKKEVLEMELDTANTDRSYLFGRLLAVAEKVERSTYSWEESSREPNAIRLQTAFAAHPMRTWAIIENALIPYYEKLKPGSRKFYKDLIGEIFGTMDESLLQQLNTPLKDSYLLGYYLQRRELNRSNKDEPNENTNREIQEEN